jgi:glycosyltransferase involved in cell wall biosynthesis
MGRRPEVSVIIPTYRRQAGLRRLLSSLAGQGPGAPRFEVIVVDDQSGEDLEPLIEGFRDRLEVRWMRSAVKGRPGARNTGAADARGGILWFLDDDMEVVAGAKKEHCRTLAGGCEVSIGAIESSSKGKSLWNALDDSRFELHRDQASGPSGPPFTAFFTGNLAIRREAFRELGGFDQLTFRYYGGEDFDMGLRCIETDMRIAHTPDALARHHEEEMGYGRYLARCRWSAASMAVFLKKHPSVLKKHPYFMEIESGPMRNTGARPWSKSAVAMVLMAPPVSELMLAAAQAIWIAGLGRQALVLSAFAKRFYFNRWLAWALGGRKAP